MNILTPVTLAAASLVLGTRSTSQGSRLLFFILQGQVDSAVLQADKHTQGKSWGSRRVRVTSCSAPGPCSGQGGHGDRDVGTARCRGLCAPGGNEHQAHPPARSSQVQEGHGSTFQQLQTSQGSVMV